MRTYIIRKANKSSRTRRRGKFRNTGLFGKSQSFELFSLSTALNKRSKSMASAKYIVVKTEKRGIKV
jgi:hypothetical protein